MRYRTNNAVQFLWRESDDKLVARSYTSEVTETVLSPELIPIIEELLTGKQRRECIETIRDYLDVSRAEAKDTFEFLTENDILIHERNDNFKTYDLWLERNWERGLYYHIDTRNRNPPSSLESGLKSQWKDPADGRETRDLVPLPEPEQLPEVTTHEVIHKRRTHRNFDETPIKEETLSSVLHHSFDPIDSDRKTDAMFADHLNIYIAVIRADGIDPGIYQYSISEHGLIPVSIGMSSEEIEDTLVSMLIGQGFFRGASIGIFFSICFDQCMESNESSRAYRRLIQDIPAHSQRLLLTATAFDLRSFLTPAIHNSEADDLLGLDGYSEATLYFNAIGE